MGNSITPVLIVVCSNILNALLDPVPVFGLGGFPRLGATGAALVTLVSQICAALVCVVLTKRRHAGLQIGAAAVANSANSVGFALYQGMVNELGLSVIAAFTIGFRVIHFFSIPGQAMAGAAAPVVGQALEAGKPALARQAVWVSVGLVAAVMFVLCALLTWQGQLAGRGFVDDPDVIREPGRFSLIAPIASYLFNVIMVLMEAFYGSGHTRPAMAMALVRLWIIRLPAAYLFGYVLGWESSGLYLAMVSGNIVSALIALWPFRSSDWQHAIVPPPHRSGTRWRRRKLKGRSTPTPADRSGSTTVVHPRLRQSHPLPHSANSNA
ncbi:MAG: MATE family efflux transporter [Candidatus Brocadiia bacterium]|nr:MATE family efflux transporter [Candidatus Brocadiia bacterium]